MARPREFDMDDLLETVMLIFWEHGLQATSMRQIEAATGVKQVSLYNAFGDKEGLFIAVMNRYDGKLSAALDKYLDDRDLDGIVDFVYSLVTPGSGYPDNAFGCLNVNTAIVAERGGSAIKTPVNKCRAMVRDKICAALLRAKNRGNLKHGLDLNHCAELLLSTIWGIFITMRLAADQTGGRPAVEGLVQILNDWSVDSSG